MELSLFGAFALLLVFNPLVLVYTYTWWLCFLGVCLYFGFVAFIYEVVLSLLFWTVPVVVHSLFQTRVDVRLPLRVGLCMFMRCYHPWNGAASLVWNHCYCVAIPWKRLAARSVLPLLSIICCVPLGPCPSWGLWNAQGRAMHNVCTRYAQGLAHLVGGRWTVALGG